MKTAKKIPVDHDSRSTGIFFVAAWPHRLTKPLPAVNVGIKEKR
jgi:hypothetical protein